MKALAIAGVNLRRLFRERSNIFWVIIAPLLFLLVLGLLFGGGQPLRIGVAGDTADPLAQRLVDHLDTDDRVEVERLDTTESLQTEVERGTVNAGLVVPEGYDQRLRDGQQAPVTYVNRVGDAAAVEAGAWVRSVVRQEAALVQAAQAGADTTELSFDEALQTAEDTTAPAVEVELTSPGQPVFPAGLGTFTPSAASMLLLFVFLTSLTAALNLIQSRRQGMTSRVFATPTSASTIVAGEALGRFAVALTQGLLIVIGSALLFGVSWGAPLGAAALLLLFCLVASGAAMLLGTLLRNEGAAIGVALGLGLGLAAVGGAMVPLEVLPPPMQTVSKLTPHAWGYEGFAELVRFDGGITDILPQLGALAGFAIVLFTLGTWRLRRVVTSPA